MIFYGIDNQTVEFRINNYQFPQNDEGDWDSNWLNIYLKVDSNLGKWQTIDPSLTTWEFKELIEWFNQVSENSDRPGNTVLTFTEPNLSFEYIQKLASGEGVIRIRFDLESRPKSATDDSTYFVDIHANNQELRRIITTLDSELQKFPERKSKR